MFSVPKEFFSKTSFTEIAKIQHQKNQHFIMGPGLFLPVL
jgi:hypothetical protein